MPRVEPWSSLERLELAARLHGLAPAPAGSAQVLEIGCGAGANLLPMAERLPGSRFVGVDEDVDAARAAAARAGLGNVELVRGAPPDGPFDYVLVPHAYARAAAEARDGLLDAIAARLAPAGVGCVVHWVTPGAGPRIMADEMLRWHTRDVPDPAARAAAARSLLELAIHASRGLDKVYCAMLVDRLADAMAEPDELEHVAAGEPILETCARLAARGLAFVGDAEPAPPLVAPDWLERAARDDLDREQYLDDAGNRKRRATVVCRAGLTIDRRPPLSRLPDLWLLEAGAGPARSFASSGIAEDELQRLVAERRVSLWLRPPPLAAAPSERPVAAPLARRAAADGAPPVNQLHEEVALDDRERRVLALLDGTRDRAALASAAGLDAEALNHSLQRLAGAALLTA